MFQQLKLSNQLCHRFYVASNALIRAYRPYLKELDITYPQYVVLMALWEIDGIEVGKIKQMTKIDGGALSLILTKLQRKKIIEMQISERDKRVRTVTLTSYGKGLESKAEHIPKQLLCKVNSISNEELQQLKLITDKLICELDDFES